MEKFVKIFKQGLSFIGISGIGWLIDFCVYNVLVLLGLRLEISNIISSFCGVTFVFFFSTRKTFDVKTERFSVKQKYFMYVLYQVVLILLASKVVGIFGEWFLATDVELLVKFAGILAKIFVTPFTMVLNFIAMKILTEKV